MGSRVKGLERALLALFVASGFAGLIYQAIWSHYLGLFLGHAAYAQALVLAIFMGGMAIGAAWIAHAGQRWRNLIRGYAIIEAVIGVLGLLFHTLFTSVSTFSYDTLIPALGEPWSVNLARWLVAAALILPQTILLGMTFPLMSGGLIRRFSGSDGQTLGGLYFTNSIGAAALTNVNGTQIPGVVNNYLNAGTIASTSPTNALDPKFKLPSQWRSTLSFDYAPDALPGIEATLGALPTADAVTRVCACARMAGSLAATAEREAICLTG